MTNKMTYSKGESVIYPSHGVGEIVGIESMDLGGVDVEMMVIKFEQERMTLRLPMNQIEESGLRRVASRNKMDNALKTLKGKSRNKTTMWARRAQEYENKINSGDPVAVAEVLRDLFRNDDQPEQSYSERQLYQSALGRFVHELAIVDHTDSDKATRRVEEMLGKDFSAVNNNAEGENPEAEAEAEAGTEATTEAETESDVEVETAPVEEAPAPVEEKPKAKKAESVKAKTATKVDSKVKKPVAKKKPNKA